MLTMDPAPASSRKRRAVDHRVETAEGLDGLVDAPSVVVDVREVADGDDPVAPCALHDRERRRRTVAVDVSERDPGALNREEHCDRFTHADETALGRGAG